MTRFYLVLCAILIATCAYCRADVRAEMSMRGAMVFVENRGQIVDAGGNPRPDILFTAEASGIKIFLHRTGISYVFTRTEDVGRQSTMQPESPVGGVTTKATEAASHLKNPRTTAYRMDVKFEESQPESVSGGEVSTEHFNYYYAHCPEGIINVKGYHRVVYHNIYPRIDLILYTREGGLKYDFVVHPGGDPGDIRMRYEGAESLRYMDSGNLQIHTPLGHLEEKRPYTYQRNSEIPSGYNVRGNVVRFEIGQYDRSHTVVIDPGVVWSTYYGGRDIATGVGTDGNGCVVVGGFTSSVDFPVQNAFQTRLSRFTDGVIIKFTPDGQLLWATYYGGSGYDEIINTSVNTAGDIVVSGLTTSTDFPIENAVQDSPGGATDAFVARWTPDGQRVWATYLGGSSMEKSWGVAIEDNGMVTAMGQTSSNDYPVLNAFQPAPGSSFDMFITRFGLNGQLLWSTYLGGSSNEDLLFEGHIIEAGTDHIAVDGSGNIVVCAATGSLDFPVLNAFQAEHNGGVWDACVTKISPEGELLWSTYYGGSDVDIAHGVAVDSEGNAVIGGITGSSDFPVQNAFQSTMQNGSSNSFLISFTGTGERSWATYITGALCHAVAADGAGNIYLTGIGYILLPVFKPWQETLRGRRDPFLLKFNQSGQRTWGTFFGGELYAPSSEDFEEGFNVAVDPSGNVVVAGYTNTTDMTMVRPWQGVLREGPSIFVVKFGCSDYPPPLAPAGPIQLCEGSTATISAPQSYGSYLWSNGATTHSITVQKSGTYSVTVSDGPGCTASTSITVEILPLPIPVIMGTTALCTGSSIRLRTPELYTSYRWKSNSTTAVLSTFASVYIAEPGEYSVTVTNDWGCVGTSAVLVVRAIPQPETDILSTPTTATTICEGDSLILAARGVFPQYLWSNGATTPSIVVKEPGKYVLLVVDEHGCISRPVVKEVEVVSLSHTAITGPPSVCRNTDRIYEVQAQPDVVYSWTVTGGTIVSDPTSATIRVRWTIAGAGSVAVTRTLLSCRVADGPLPIVVGDSVQPVIVGASEVCPGGSIVLAVEDVYSTYQWSDGQTSAILTITNPGIYTVRVTESEGCSGTSLPFIVTTADLPIPSIVVDGLKELCEGDSTILRVSEEFVSYLWSNGSTLASIVVFSPGTVVVSVVNSNGCLGTTTLTIPAAEPPHPSIEGPVSICRHAVAEYTVVSSDPTPFVQWSVAGGGILSGSSSATVQVQWGNGPIGTLVVRIGREGTACMGETTVEIHIEDVLHPIVTSASLVLCPDGEVALRAPWGYSSYLWTPGGGTGATLTVTQPGIYSVHVRDASGCEGVSDPVEVREGTVLWAVITAVPASPCEGEPVVLSAGNFASYLWSTGETTATIRVDADGEYSVTVKDASGCSDFTSAVVQHSRNTLGRSESVVWSDVVVGTTQQFARTWTNDDDETVRVESWSFIPDIPEFDAVFTPLLPADIPPGGSLAITVRFSPGKPGVYKSELVVESPQPCAQTWRISFNATAKDGNGSVRVRAYFPDTTAFPWQRGYRIPLRAQVLRSEIKEPRIVEFTATMDASVFFPTGLTRGVITGNAVDALTGERIITARVDNVQFGEHETVVAEIVGDVLLGERDNTALLLQKFDIVDLPADVEKQNGILVLEGICREGDARFVRSMEGFGITVQPHPVEDELIALVEVVESGSCCLELYSADGRKEVVREWSHVAGSEGATIVRYDVSAKSAGVYWLVLRTPTQAESTMVVIVQ